MGRRTWIGSWSAYRQLTGKDRLGLGAAVKSSRSAGLRPRVADADRIVKSVCPYCAVGCGHDVYVKDGAVTQIEGDPDSPVSRGRLCPNGSASLQLTTGEARQYRVLCRQPWGTEWEQVLKRHFAQYTHLSLDPNVHIQEVKALACDIRPGRRPRGPALRALVREYQHRAGITDQTGTEM